MEATLQGFGALSEGTGRRRTSNKRRPPAKRAPTPQQSSRPYADYVRKGDLIRVYVKVAPTLVLPYTSSVTDTLKSRLSNAGYAVQTVDDSGVASFAGGELLVILASDGDHANISDVTATVVGAANSAGYRTGNYPRAEFISKVEDPQHDTAITRSNRNSNTPRTNSGNSGGATNYSLFGSTPNGLPPVPGTSLIQSIKDDFATASFGALAVTLGLLFVVFKK